MADTEVLVDSDIPNCSSRRAVLWPQGVRPLDEAMSEIVFLLPTAQESELERLAKHRGITVAHLVRGLIQNHLNGSRSSHLRVFSTNL